jgi:hypothetical protein
MIYLINIKTNISQKRFKYNLLRFDLHKLYLSYNLLKLDSNYTKVLTQDKIL